MKIIFGLNQVMMAILDISIITKLLNADILINFKKTYNKLQVY